MISEVLIGSAAIEYNLGSVLRRKPHDIDFLSFTPLKNADSIDGHGILDAYNFRSEIATVDELYTLKVSHSPWVVKDVRNWYKHLRDIQVLKKWGGLLIPELHDAAYRQWELRKGAKNVNLARSKEEFFNESVRRFYDHDVVHNAVALGCNPAFNKILKDGSEVSVSEAKFMQLTSEEKSFVIFEEVFVLSLERDLIPLWKRTDVEPSIEDIYRSYSKQLRLLVTSYSKGWFPRYIIENFAMVGEPLLDYWSMFRDSVER